MKFLFSVILFFFAYGFFSAAPLESGYPLAPRPSASQEEKERSYMEIRNRVISSAMKYENTPYRYGGMSSSGLDCSGFICLSFKDALGVTLPRSASGLYSWTERIPLDKAQPGDLLFFSTGNSSSITHVALYLGNRRFIHSASVGPQTGVILTTLDEGSWSRTYAGAGRVFPEAPSSYYVYNASITSNNAGGQSRSISPVPVNTSSGSSSTRLLAGAALAPTWNGILKDGSIIRGFAGQVRFGVDFRLLKTRMIFGSELRPEYDGALGVFRLPLTFSWGLGDKLRFFAGPVVSFGDASLSTTEGERSYAGGTSWLGTVGITAAPFIINTKSGEFAPYFEAAWQSYFNNNQNHNFNADFSACFRFSTGIRWTMQIR